MSPINILIADDDEDDIFFAVEALNKSRLANNVFCVKDGAELLDFLNKHGKYTAESAPTPDLILLDLNMPKKNGREALKEIKSDERFDQIPVVILTTSDAEQDIIASYKLGANSYINKPVDFDGLVDIMKALKTYWVQFVKLPPNGARREISSDTS
ncbi:MAG TPA: response regulator [Candidatus Limnocylindrales bacterium]|nr:response regulator [Candidatus Limnocylindrales bacterium]